MPGPPYNQTPPLRIHPNNMMYQNDQPPVPNRNYRGAPNRFVHAHPPSVQPSPALRPQMQLPPQNGQYRPMSHRQSPSPQIHGNSNHFNHGRSNQARQSPMLHQQAQPNSNQHAHGQHGYGNRMTPQPGQFRQAPTPPGQYSQGSHQQQVILQNGHVQFQPPRSQMNGPIPDAQANSPNYERRFDNLKISNPRHQSQTPFNQHRENNQFWNRQTPSMQNQEGLDSHQQVQSRPVQSNYGHNSRSDDPFKHVQVWQPPELENQQPQIQRAQYDRARKPPNQAMQFQQSQSPHNPSMEYQPTPQPINQQKVAVGSKVLQPKHVPHYMMLQQQEKPQTVCRGQEQNLPAYPPYVPSHLHQHLLIDTQTSNDEQSPSTWQSVGSSKPEKKNSETSPSQKKTTTPPAPFSKVVLGSGSPNQVFCPIKNLSLFSVPQPIGPNHIFHFDPQLRKLVEHMCHSCVYQIKETDISPIYSVMDDNRNQLVIFAKNKINEQIEQFIYCSEYGGLEQVDRPEMIFNSKTESSTLISVHFGEGNDKVIIMKDEVEKTWKKVSYGMQLSDIAPIPIKTLMIKAIEKEGKEKNRFVYTDPHPTYIIKYCNHLKKDMVKIKSEDGVVSNYVYSEKARQFWRADCYHCEDDVTEDNLLPKYAEYSDFTSGFVIYAANTKTREIEKYIFDYSTLGFRQVQFPFVQYDPRRATTGTMICSLDYKQYSSQILIKRDFEGRITKELLTDPTKEPIKLAKTSVYTWKLQTMENEFERTYNIYHAPDEEKRYYVGKSPLHFLCY